MFSPFYFFSAILIKNWPIKCLSFPPVISDTTDNLRSYLCVLNFTEPEYC